MHQNAYVKYFCYCCHLRIKSGLFLDELKFKSAHLIFLITFMGADQHQFSDQIVEVTIFPSPLGGEEIRGMHF